ncbi:MAG: hypothetical protein DHS20C18_40900 [Saprospiraceae bacterium]|nr:MAG: hypothetical protein DHS20C18_40900 [Saprospiraceae bacterium]
MKQKKESLLWRIESNDLPGPSFLLGTMHIRDQRAFGLLELVYEKINTCAAFAAEIDLQVTEIPPEKLSMNIPPSKWLDQMLSPRQFQKMRQIILKGTGLDLYLYRFLHPMVINNLILERILSKDMSIALDRHLWDYAQEQGKQLLGIETLEEQLAIMQVIPFQRHLKDLLGMSKNFTRYRRHMHHLVHLYQEGALQRLHKASKKGAGSFRRMMIYDRNVNMADRIADMVGQQTTFCAIGAGHLGGSKGVLRLLKKKGLKVKPEFPN